MQTFLVGGLLNGKRVDLDTVTQVLKVPYKRDPQAWTADQLELYALGDKGPNGFRYYVGSEDLSGWPIEIEEKVSQAHIANIVKLIRNAPRSAEDKPEPPPTF